MVSGKASARGCERTAEWARRIVLAGVLVCAGCGRPAPEETPVSSAPSAAEAPAPVGRFVRLEHRYAFINLCEVEVYSAGENVARQGQATQSVIPGPAYGPEKGIDGIVSGRERNMFHTGNGPDEWWEVDLGADYPVDRIRLVNREEVVQERASWMRVKLLDADRQVVWQGRVYECLPVMEFQPALDLARDALPPVVEGRKAAGRIELARDGRAAANLVIDAADTGMWEELARRDLRHYLRLATGADFPVVQAADAPTGVPGIYLGSAALRRLGLDRAAIREDAWFVTARDGDLCLYGDARGTALAVWHFLESQVGVRWWSNVEEDVPSTPSLRVAGDLRLSGRPAFKTTAYGVGLRLAARNGIMDRGLAPNPSTAGLSGHSVAFLVPPSRYGAEHPEWFAMVNGKRMLEPDYRVDLCYSTSDERLVAAFADGVLEYIAKEKARSVELGKPEGKHLDVMRMDNAPWCECPACQAAYAASSRSEVYLAFVNRVAERVRAVAPDYRLLHGAYQYSRTPPTSLRLAANIMPRYDPHQCRQ